MNDEPENVVPIPVIPQERPKRKYVRRKYARREQKPQAAAAYAGLTASQCADACHSKKCAISGMGYCAHPRKGGLHMAEMLKPAIVARFNAAKKQIEHALVEAKTKSDMRERQDAVDGSLV